MAAAWQLGTRSGRGMAAGVYGRWIPRIDSLTYHPKQHIPNNEYVNNECVNNEHVNNEHVNNEYVNNEYALSSVFRPMCKK